MKDLKIMSREDRLDVTLRCEPFFLSVSKTKGFDVIHKEIINVVGSKYKVEVWCIITAIGKARRYGCTGSQLSLSQGDYTKANSIHSKGISLSRMKELIEILESNNYISFYKGFRDYTGSIKSCFIFHDKLNTLFSKVKTVGIKRDYSGVVEIKDKQGNAITSLRGYGGTIDRSLVEDYNDDLIKHTIVMQGILLTPYYKRVYDGTPERGGRFYTFGTFQSIPKTMRKSITINGSVATEIDYSANHARILYEIEGVRLPINFDPYSVVSHLSRKEVKLLFLCCINNNKRSTAVKAFVYKSKYKYYEIDKVVSLLMAHNSLIQHKFFSEIDMWARLQNIDSKMAEFIIKVFVAKGYCVLSYHDSFIIEDKYEVLLRKVMKDAWADVLGSSFNYKVTKEF